LGVQPLGQFLHLNKETDVLNLECVPVQCNAHSWNSL